MLQRPEQYRTQFLDYQEDLMIKEGELELQQSDGTEVFDKSWALEGGDVQAKHILISRRVDIVVPRTHETAVRWLVTL